MTPKQPENLQLYLPHTKITPENNYRGREIPHGIECPNCGYDLRGLKRGQPCPECGRLTMRIGREVHCSDLDVEYLKGMAHGVRLVLFGWMFMLPAPFFASIFSFTDNKLLYLVDFGVLLTAWGVWMLTNPGAMKSATDTAILPRHRVSRMLVIVTAFSFLIFQSMTYGTMIASNQWFWFLISYLCYLTLQVLTCQEGVRLSNLIPAVVLGINFQIISWVLPITGLAGLIMIVIEPSVRVSVAVGMTTVLLFLCSEFAFILLLTSLQKKYIRIIRSQK